MPIYEYECDKCGATFEAIQAISAKPLKTCNGLGCDDKDNGKVHRLVSASGFILKGSGWYTSEYPSESRKKGWEQESKQGKADPATPAPAPSETSSAKAPDPKPAAPAKKPSPKNPYSGGKSKKAKGSK
ncbi:MAG: zinc ribbon domain-containing protein [Nitrospina sp.]|jgi:putative FmdB family regulatory protein|nr:zinc ribbon domain-containing protein [Nitrospina sp.]MBT3509372.1 zinc ribbon domain-containing protein [Nitrospina sp.]MBT3876166.1 zinc ribbon domain-containing protein [Nitrospina sp.]MBT4048923.1 zinc ribbon domain-containing protein [Nitrospina sp.]MBT4557734.1 zinc ribbon domain-containing protein [Nitrospina sp.]